MFKRTLGAVGLVVSMAAVWVGAPLAQGGDHSILLTILDKDGAPLRDLKPDEFIVQDGGERKDVTAAALTTDPLDVALVVDTAKPTIGSQFPTRELRDGLAALVKAVYAENPQSRVSLMEYAGAAVQTVDYTNDGDKILKSVNRLVASQRSSGVLLEGLLDTGKDLQKSKTLRRAIVVVSLGSPDDGQTQPRDAAMAIQKAGASFWAVAVGTSAPAREVIFENLPPITGGQRLTMVAPTGLVAALTKVGAALTSQYVVTFKSAGAPSQNLAAGAKRGEKVLMSPVVR